MPNVRIDARRITDWESFHDVFAESFGFPEFYGRNLDAWIDCMTCLDEPDSGMSSVHGTSSDSVVIQFDHVNHLPTEIYDAVVECSAFVNYRRLAANEPAILCLSFYRSAK